MTRFWSSAHTSFVYARRRIGGRESPFSVEFFPRVEHHNLARIRESALEHDAGERPAVLFCPRCRPKLVVERSRLCRRPPWPPTPFVTTTPSRSTPSSPPSAAVTPRPSPHTSPPCAPSSPGSPTQVPRQSQTDVVPEKGFTTSNARYRASGRSNTVIFAFWCRKARSRPTARS